MIEITMDEWEKMHERAELKKVVDKTIKSIANEIQEKDIMPGQYPDTIRALAELVTARAALAQGNEKINEEVCSQDLVIEALVKPIVEWLKTQDPYLEVHISSEYIKLVRTEKSIPVNETVSL